MAVELTDDISSDEILVAYLDGELSPEDSSRVKAMIEENADVAQRFSVLATTGLPFREAFDMLLDEAPRDRLHAFLLTPSTVALQLSRRWALGSIAAAVACVALGVIGERSYQNWRGIGPMAAAWRWREAVAAYMHLYTAETFAQLGETPELVAAQFQTVSEALKIPLTEASITLPDRPFRRAELLNYEDQPLAQIGYLDPRYGPVAFCLKPADFGQAPPQVDQQMGMNIVYWSSVHYAYLVIGRNPIADLRGIADTLGSRITA